MNMTAPKNHVASIDPLTRNEAKIQWRPLEAKIRPIITTAEMHIDAHTSPIDHVIFVRYQTAIEMRYSTYIGCFAFVECFLAMHVDQLCCDPVGKGITRKVIRQTTALLRRLAIEGSELLGVGAQPGVIVRELGGNVVYAFCIHKHALQSLNFNQVRDLLTSQSECSSPSAFVQVLGDSTPQFSAEGTVSAEREVNRILSGLTMNVLWGFTGSLDATDGGKDVNQIVNDWIDADPDFRSKLCYANIVDKGTIDALTSYGCLCPTGPARVRNFILVTGGADFGDDVILSDGLTDHLLLLEGGLQSFRHAVNCLLRGCQITAICGIRREAVRNRFSATRLLQILIAKHSDDSNALTQVKNDYLSAHPLTEMQSPSFEAAWASLSSSDALAWCLNRVTIIEF